MALRQSTELARRPKVSRIIEGRWSATFRLAFGRRTEHLVGVLPCASVRVATRRGCVRGVHRSLRTRHAQPGGVPWHSVEHPACSSVFIFIFLVVALGRWGEFGLFGSPILFACCCAGPWAAGRAWLPLSFCFASPCRRRGAGLGPRAWLAPFILYFCDPCYFWPFLRPLGGSSRIFSIANLLQIFIALYSYFCGALQEK